MGTSLRKKGHGEQSVCKKDSGLEEQAVRGAWGAVHGKAHIERWDAC